MRYISDTDIPHYSALYLAVLFRYTGLVYLSFFFNVLLQNCEKPLSLCLSALTNLAPTGWIFMKFDI